MLWRVFQALIAGVFVYYGAQTADVVAPGDEGQKRAAIIIWGIIGLGVAFVATYLISKFIDWVRRDAPERRTEAEQSDQLPSEDQHRRALSRRKRRT